MNYQNKSKISNQIPILTAAIYRAKLGQKNAQPTSEQIQESLLYYEKNMRILQASLKLMKIKNEKAQIRYSFNLIKKFERIQFTEDEKSYLSNKIFQNAQLEEQLCYLIEEKIENEENQNKTFIQEIKQIYYEEELELSEKVFNLNLKLHDLINKNLFGAFSQIKQKGRIPVKKTIQNLTIKRALIKNMTSMINDFIIKRKQMAFHRLQEVSLKIKLKNQEKKTLGLQQKGRKLLSLSFYPQFQVKSALWRWYLSTSEKGTQLFVRAANKLVIYTNVNKITAFYRLMIQVKGIRTRIPPRVKRMATIVHAYTKLFFERAKRFGFDQLKFGIEKKKILYANKILKAAEMRMRSALGMWLKQITLEAKIKQNQQQRQKIEEQNKKRKSQITIKKIIESSIKRKRQALKLWRDFSTNKQNKQNSLKRTINKIISAKIGLIQQCLKRIKSLPDNEFIKKRGKKATQFQKGLMTFAHKILNKCFQSFLDQYRKGQLIKSKGVIELINCSKIKKQKMYNRWKQLMKAKKLMNKCKKLSDLFTKINKTIKSVADNAFISTRNKQIKQQAILKLFSVFNSRMKDSFIRWRQVNRLQKIRQRINQEQKNFVIKLLDNLLHNNKNKKIREVIEKFKTNFKINNYKRNFLKRLLQSKIGKTALALKIIRNLPQKLKNDRFTKAHLFEKGLSIYAYKILRESYDRFKDKYDQAQNMKRRAVIQMISCATSGQKKFYNRWKQMSQMKVVMSKCKIVLSIFNQINFSIKNTSDYVFIPDINRQKAVSSAISKILQASIKRKRNSLKIWLNNTKQFEKRQNFKLFILRKILNTKVGRIKQAIQKIKSIPETIIIRSDKKQNLFKQKLQQFANRVLAKSFKSFKDQYQSGQTLKKRAAIQFMNCMISKRKKIYSQWRELTKRNQMINKCKKMVQFMSLLNLTIKSVADNAFISQNVAKMKEKELTKLLNAFNSGLRDSFIRWRQINRIQKIRQKLNQGQKNFVIKLLENLLHTSKEQRVREAIAKFKQNFKINNYKRNFLKRLLVSKIGMVELALHTIRNLPQKSTNKRHGQYHVFERGLSKFALKKLRESFDRFKDEYEQAQNIKKRAVIEMINCATNRQKKLYNHWKNLTYQNTQIQKAKKVLNIIQKLNASIKSITDLAFQKAPQKNNKYQILQNLILKKQNPLKQTFKIWKQKATQIKLIQIFKTPTHILSRNNIEDILSYLKYKNVKVPRMILKKYRLNEVQYLVKYILRLLSSRKSSLKSFYQRMKQIPEPKTRINPWFKRSVQILSLNTRINVQKSFWRMIYNSESSGITFNAAVIVKLKKMYNNIKKTYILNLYHAFLMIDRRSSIVQRQMYEDYYEEGQVEQELIGSQKGFDSFSEFQFNRSRSRSKASIKQKIFVENKQMILTQINTEISLENSRKISVRSMGRIFKKFLKKRVQSWVDIALPINKYSLNNKDQKQQLYIARLGATQSVQKINKKLTMLIKQKAFDQILRISCQFKWAQQHEQNVGQITDIVQRHQLLLQQIKHYKGQYEMVCGQLEQKQMALRQADNMITVLSLRNNYVITHKFISHVQQVFYNVYERHLDEAFEAIMQEANRSFQKSATN